MRIRDDVSFPDTMMRLHLNTKVLYPKYLELYLLSESGRRQIQRGAAGTSHSMKKINRRSLARIIVPLPSPETQIHVCSQVKSLDEKITDVEAQVKVTMKVKASILHSLVPIQ